MDNFDIFLAYINFTDLPYGKVRPTVMVEVELSESTVALLAIYSYKDNWQQLDKYKDKIKIVEWKTAGLTNPNSYIDISEVIEYDKTELLKFEKIGHLADVDIKRLNEALENRAKKSSS